MMQRQPSVRQWFTRVPMNPVKNSNLKRSDGTSLVLLDRSDPEIADLGLHPSPLPLVLPENFVPTATPETRQLELSVVIPHLNEPEHLTRCLRSLDRERAGSVAFEVIVVDNGSREPIDHICRAFSGVRLVLERVPGPGPARNRGAALAKGEIIAFIDADCVAHPGWAEAIVDAFHQPGVDVVGGDIGILPRSVRRTALEAYEGLYSYRARLFVERHGYAATGNMAVRAEVFRRVGPFQGLGTHEDVVWGRRAREAGCSIVFKPGIAVSTDACDSFDALAKRLDRLVVHSHSDTWLRGRLTWGLRTFLIILSPLYEIPTILTSDKLTGARERLEVFALLARARFHRAKRMIMLWHSESGSKILMSWNRE